MADVLTHNPEVAVLVIVYFGFTSYITQLLLEANVSLFIHFICEIYILTHITFKSYYMCY